MQCKLEIDQIIVPRSIQYESKEYIITSILNGDFTDSHLRSLQFTTDSELQTIDNEAFCNLQIYITEKLSYFNMNNSLTSIK